MTLNTAGFTPKTLIEIETELDAKLRERFGATLLLTPDTALGKLKTTNAEREEQLWQLLQALYDSFNPITASDVSLDRIAAITGVERNPATRSLGLLYLAGDTATNIPIGTLLGVEDSNERFRTTAVLVLADTDDFTIVSAAGVSVTLVQVAGTATATATAHGLPNGAIVTISGANETGYNITAKISNVSANAFDFTVDSGTVSPATGVIEFIDEGLAQDPDGTIVTVRSVAHGLVAADIRMIIGATEAIYNRVFSVVASLDVDHFTYDGLVDFNVFPATGGYEGKHANSVAIESVSTGIIAGLAHTVNIIINAISGLDEVDNIGDVTTGVAVETDATFRVRRTTALQGLGNATLEAIRGDMLLVPGVTVVFVFENETDITQGIRTPHSIEVVLDGGVDTDIATALFNTKGGGIATVGTNSANHTDSQGTVHSVAFSRPAIRDIWIDIDVTVDAEYPADGDTQVADALKAFGDANYGIGDDVIPLPELVGSIALIPGIRDVAIGVLDVPDGDPDPGPIPGTDDGPITIAETDVAEFDTGRITVVST